MQNARWIVATLWLTFASSIVAQCAIDPAVYVRLFENNMPMFKEMTRRVQESGATTVLDLGTGPGEPSTLMAKAMPNIHVTSTDVQAGMIEKAKQRAAGLPNIDFAVTSADDLSAFPASSFGALTMCYVLMFVPDRAKSIAEITRVLEPKGQAYIAVWKKLAFMKQMQDALEELMDAVPPSFPVNPMALSAENAVEDLVAATTGVHVVSTDLISYSFALGDAKAACESAMILTASAIKLLEDDGNANAKEEYCAIFVRRLKDSGSQKADGTFEIDGNTAQLLVLQKSAESAEL